MGVPLSRKSGYIKIGEFLVEITGLVALGTGLIPVDATIPQISEGNQVFSFSYTPKYVGSLLVFTSQIFMNSTSVGTNFFYGLWLDSATDAYFGGGGFRYILKVLNPAFFARSISVFAILRSSG